jgi:hypothetical protein
VLLMCAFDEKGWIAKWLCRYCVCMQCSWGTLLPARTCNTRMHFPLTETSFHTLRRSTTCPYVLKWVGEGKGCASWGTRACGS